MDRASVSTFTIAMDPDGTDIKWLFVASMGIVILYILATRLGSYLLSPDDIAVYHKIVKISAGVLFVSAGFLFYKLRKRTDHGR